MATFVELTDETFRQFCDDTEYFNSHWEEIRDAHPNCHVAVYKGQVVAAGPKLKQVLKELDRQEVPTNTVVIRFIAHPPRVLIL